MKRSTILCASVVALVAFAISASGASAATYSTTKSNTRAGGMTTAPKPSSGGPKTQDQSTTFNTSRSNIKNNMGVAPRMGGGGGGRTK